jgi:S1-C subfamily serine protease
MGYEIIRTSVVLLVAFTGQIALASGREALAQASPTSTEATANAAATTMENAVVKVFSTVIYPDYYKPWVRQAPSELIGSGVIIEGKRILTNAHLVRYASQVQVQASQSSEKVPASVAAIADDVDLAVLQLEDERFFESRNPLPRVSNLPPLKDTVTAYGYPIGGNSLSVTKGIVSRIEFTGSNPFAAGHLQIQIDAAINPGNSGGPAAVDDKMIGLAFSYVPSAQSIGYIIPSEEIDIFLEDIIDGHYDGKPTLPDELQTLENPALRARLKLPSSADGMVVHKIAKGGPAYPLKKWDLITKIGDKAIDNQGMIGAGAGLRVRFPYEIQHLAKGGRVPLTIVRDGRELQIELPVAPARRTLVADLHGAYPPYFVYGPLVFSTATMPFLGGFVSTLARNPMNAFNLMTGPLMKRMFDEPAFDGEQLVVVSSPFFPHKLSRGYGDPVGDVVDSINGTHVKNLAHLVELLRDASGEFIVIEFEGRGGETLVFRRQEMLAGTDEILSTNGVRSQGSPEMLQIWSAKQSH